MTECSPVISTSLSWNIKKGSWLKTGDLGYVDEDGFIHLTGCKKNLIITQNGENVSPEEIENKLSAGVN